jgi:hypothetical protein
MLVMSFTGKNQEFRSWLKGVLASYLALALVSK